MPGNRKSLRKIDQISVIAKDVEDKTIFELINKIFDALQEQLPHCVALIEDVKPFNHTDLNQLIALPNEIVSIHTAVVNTYKLDVDNNSVSPAFRALDPQTKHELREITNRLVWLFQEYKKIHNDLSQIAAWQQITENTLWFVTFATVFLIVVGLVAAALILLNIAAAPMLTAAYISIGSIMGGMGALLVFTNQIYGFLGVCTNQSRGQAHQKLTLLQSNLSRIHQCFNQCLLKVDSIHLDKCDASSSEEKEKKVEAKADFHNSALPKLYLLERGVTQAEMASLRQKMNGLSAEAIKANTLTLQPPTPLSED